MHHPDECVRCLSGDICEDSTAGAALEPDPMWLVWATKHWDALQSLLWIVFGMSLGLAIGAVYHVIWG
jgi:hypothetical protein